MFDRDDCPEHGHRDNRVFDVSEALRADYTTGVANSKADPAIYHTYPRRSTRGSTSLSQPHAFKVPTSYHKSDYFPITYKKAAHIYCLLINKLLIMQVHM